MNIGDVELPDEERMSEMEFDRSWKRNLDQTLRLDFLTVVCCVASGKN